MVDSERKERRIVCRVLGICVDKESVHRTTSVAVLVTQFSGGSGDWYGHGIYKATHVLPFSDRQHRCAVLYHVAVGEERSVDCPAGDKSFADHCTEETSAATTSTASVTDRSVRK